MATATTDPTTGQVVRTFDALTAHERENRLVQAAAATLAASTRRPVGGEHRRRCAPRSGCG